MESSKNIFGILCLSFATGLFLYWIMFLMSNFPRMLRYGLTTPIVYFSTGVVGSVSVALCIIGIISVKETMPAKPIKTLVLARNAKGEVVSINQADYGSATHGKTKVAAPRAKPNPKTPRQGKHRKAKSVLIGSALTAIALGFYVSMMAMTGYSIQDVTSGMFSPFMAVSSQSMQPVLNYGDLILVRREQAENIEVGDIIAFNVPSPYNLVAQSPTVHKVVEKLNENGEIYFKTKGDNNPTEDQWTVPAKNVIGKYVGKAPYIGLAALFLGGPFGLAVISVLITLSFIYPYFKKKRIGGMNL
jgi:signal peptidase I